MTKLQALKDGPILVEIDDTKFALCRCGQSGSKPYCDGTHKQCGFKDEAVQLWPELTTTKAHSEAQ